MTTKKVTKRLPRLPRQKPSETSPLKSTSAASPKPSKDSGGQRRTRPRHHEGCNCKDCKPFRAPSVKVTTAIPVKPRTTKVKAAPPKAPAVAEGIVVYDPAHPNVLFDNLVRVYATCRDCGEKMQVIRADCTVHPCCEPKPTHVESLATGWLSCVEAGDDESAALTEAEIDRLEAEPIDMKAAALQYISWGWPVFPLVPKSKKPATKNGLLDATLKESWVCKWWNRNPQYNIGLPTGYAFDVFDIDPANGGVPSFLELLAAQRIPEAHGIVVTSSGGMHFYLMPTGKRNRAGFMPGLDYRGKGGYVVAPPSTLGPRGRAWSWLTVPSPDITKEGEF